MYNFVILFILISVIIVFVAGAIFGIKYEKKAFPICIGRLNIDRSEEDGSKYLFLEIDKGMMDEITPGKVISVKVTERNYLDSHE